MKSKGLLGLYFVVGVLGVVAGVANFLQKHYVFAAIYGLFGGIWLLMALLKSRVEASPAPGPSTSALPAEQTPKPTQS
jgi:membrane associated rhomboid family serine protease